MAESVDNLILEQLRALRDEMQQMNGRMTSLEQTMQTGFEDAEIGRQAIQGVLMGLGHSIYGLNERVEHIEEKLGIDT